MNSLQENKKEYDSLFEQLSDPALISDGEKIKELLGKKEKLEKTIELQEQIEQIARQIEENKIIINSEKDRELSFLAEQETIQLQEKEKKLLQEIENIEKEEKTPSLGQRKGGSVIIEIRAGTGGDEAALFATNLYKMYSKYALSLGWEVKTLDSHPTDIGGFKEVVFEINPVRKTKFSNGVKPSLGNKQNDAYGLLKNEGGVHRVQRIPKTEKSGRVHTSTATVAILAKPKSTEISIKPADLKITFFKASGPGGQYVNKTESAVRILHVPSGIVVASQSERNQLQNKENALSILSAKVLQLKEEKEQSEISGKRNSQIGSAKRAEKIRTYNFPQDRITDHRIKKSWNNIEEIMEGRIEKMIESVKNLED